MLNQCNHRTPSYRMKQPILLADTPWTAGSFKFHVRWIRLKQIDLLKKARRIDERTGKTNDDSTYCLKELYRPTRNSTRRCHHPNAICEKRVQNSEKLLLKATL